MKMGQLQLTNDINYVMMNSNVCTVICFSLEAETNLQFMQSIDPISAPILLPPYEVIMSLDMNSYQSGYFNYLASNKEAAEMIALILKAMALGNNVVLYVTPDESQLPYAEIFKQYIYSNFGIVIGNEITQSTIEPSLIFNSFNYQYLFNLISGGELLDLWSSFKTLPALSEDIVMKLATEFNPYGNFNSLNDYYEYFKQLCNNDVRLEIAIRKVK